MPDNVFDALRRLAEMASGNAYTPFSKQPVASVALLSNGTWVPGVRVENASFPLTILALTAAYSAARCAGRDDFVAVVQNQPFRDTDPLFLSEALGCSWKLAEPDVLVKDGFDEPPMPGNRLEIFLAVPSAVGDEEMLLLADRAAQRAHNPESGFPVGCVVLTEDGSLIPGCNVEHSDWTRGLCAERIALATALAYGHSVFLRIYLTCPHEQNASPCGACRQVLFELAAGVPIVMSRGVDPPKITTPEQLLPDGFRGDALRS